MAPLTSPNSVTETQVLIVGAGPDPDIFQATPTLPGARLPHVWLADGTALHDRLGPGYTLLRLGATRESTKALREAFQKWARRNVLETTEKRVREVYERHLLLIRPDLHIVWWVIHCVWMWPSSQ